MAAGNTELCEIVDVEPKSQCRACLTNWSAGIVYCTCGHLMEDDTTENKKYISSVLDLFSIPNFYIRKGRPHGHRYGKKAGCKEYHTANQLQKRCRKKKYENIHDRFIRWQFLQKNDDRVGSLWRDHPWDGSACKRRPQSYCHTRRNWCQPWQLVDPLECGEFLYDADKASTWLQESIVDFASPQESGGQDARWKLVAQFLLMVAMANYLVASLWWDFTTKMGWPLIERGNQCTQWTNYSFVAWISARIWCKIYRDFFGNSQRSLLSPTGGKENTSWYRKSRTKWQRKST